MKSDLVCADCLSWMKDQPADICDMTLGSPPYEDARTYGIGYALKGQGWVDWMIPRVAEMCRVTSGLVFLVMAGRRVKWQYSPVVEWLVADLTRQHDIICGPAPYVYHRGGVPGSGSGRYHRRDWEPVYVFALPDNVPPAWTDNTAMGRPPKYETGGRCSNRHADGRRMNEKKYGALDRKTPSETMRKNGAKGNKGYAKPAIADPGNVISGHVGKGHMGSDLAHETEAPFPEWLAEFFILSYCPPGGTVLDPFCGSGTTMAVAKTHGRGYIGVDVRQSQVDLSRKRMGTIQPVMF